MRFPKFKIRLKLHPRMKVLSNGSVIDTGGYALVSAIDPDERYSATKGDYWNLPENHVFSDDEGLDMDLAEMGYDEDGRYVIKRIVKRGPVRKGDLPVD